MPENPTVDAIKTGDAPIPVPPPSAIDATVTYAEGNTLSKPSVPRPDWPVIPGYIITGEIAKGGMGRVFAGRDLTLDREVAIKTLLPGADAERFVTESKITARLPHPGIPPVHALGTLGDGSHYLAMKLIRGRTLAELLKERQSPRDDLSRWLQIFEQIAQAVGFAHAQGIIHRDLTPLNVMVGAFGEVQVMDWGLAKDIQSPLPARSATEGPTPQTVAHAPGSDLTQPGAIMGTPGYMAPEQARAEVVDARADVFALGAMLTTILTGKPPFGGDTIHQILARAANAELADAFARLDGCGADAELIALAKRCLSAKADDRPADARVVAEQVAAYRAGVEARLRQAETDRAAALVRAAEESKRRTVLQISAGVIAIVLIAGIIGTTIGMVSASNEAAEKETARQNEANAKIAEIAARNAEKARADGEEEAKRLAEARSAEATRRLELFLGVVADIDYGKARDEGKALTDELAKNLINAAKRLEAEPPADPLKLAELQNRIGTTLLTLGYAGDAIPLFLKASGVWSSKHGPDHPHTLTSMNNLADAYDADGQLKKALPLYEETLAKKKTKLGPDHPDTLTSMNNLALVYRADGQLKKALPLLEETLAKQKTKLGPDHPHTLTTMANLARAYQDDGNPAGALLLLEAKALATEKRTAGEALSMPERHSLANQQDQVGEASLNLKKYPDAETWLRKSLANFEITIPDTWGVFDTRSMLGAALAGQKKYQEAEPLLLAGYKGLKERKMTVPAAKKALVPALDRLVQFYEATGNAVEAERYRKELAARKAPKK